MPLLPCLMTMEASPPAYLPLLVTLFRLPLIPTPTLHHTFFSRDLPCLLGAKSVGHLRRLGSTPFPTLTHLFCSTSSFSHHRVFLV